MIDKWQRNIFSCRQRKIILFAVGEGGRNNLKHDDRFNELERSVQLSCPLSLSLPEAEQKQPNLVLNKKKLKLIANWIRA